MPLVIMCGIPDSGKTTRAKHIAQYLTEKHKQNVVIVNEQSLKINKDEAYSSSHEQKMTRGKIKFQTEKSLTGNTVVIADSLNYIKGFRYQMYCIAREQKTTYCVVYCNTQLEGALKFNEKHKKESENEEKHKSGQYFGSDQMIEELSKRMQAPKLKDRWDIPLFERRPDEDTPVEDIAQVLLFESKKSKDPVSTKTEQKLGENYLYEMDSICQQVCNDTVMGKMKLKNNWTALQLKKVKKDFVNMIKENPIGLKSVRESFLNYLMESDKRK